MAERRTRNPKDRGLNPVRTQHTNVTFAVETATPALDFITTSDAVQICATLLQLAFLGESDPNFPWEKFQLGQQNKTPTKRTKNSTAMLLHTTLRTNKEPPKRLSSECIHFVPCPFLKYQRLNRAHKKAVSGVLSVVYLVLFSLFVGL